MNKLLLKMFMLLMVLTVMPSVIMGQQCKGDIWVHVGEQKLINPPDETLNILTSSLSTQNSIRWYMSSDDKYYVTLFDPTWVTCTLQIDKFTTKILKLYYEGSCILPGYLWEYEGYYNIHIQQYIEEITLSETSISLNLVDNKSKVLKVTNYVPSEGVTAGFSWTSENENVATVKNGLVTAVGLGETNIICTASDGGGANAKCKVLVESIPVERINLNETSITFDLNNGSKTKQLSAEVLPANASNKSVTWSVNSGGESVCSVSNTGLVTAKAVGSATVTCAAKDGSGVKATCNVKVEKNPILVTKINLNQTSITFDLSSNSLTKQLTAEVLPTNATNKTVSWSVTPKEGVVTVNNSGYVTAVAAGNATITCAATDGSGVTATCSVRVNPPTGISVNASNFPDENFRNYLLGTTEGKDGILTENEIKGITIIGVSDKNIKDLKGIEFFTYLALLHCYKNQLTSLDISKNTLLENLACDGNQLTSLDISKNNLLEYLACYNNQLTSLDVSKNTLLTRLACFGNQLTSLDISKNNLLEYLACNDNQLTSLDVSKNTSLTSLSCYNNQLTSLDVSKNTSLTSLSCYNNQLTSLDISKNNLLEYLACNDNQLTSLDVSKNTSLTSLVCYNNQLTSLDLSKCSALTGVTCSVNKIKGTAMDNLVNGLPKNTTTDEHRFRVFNSVDIKEGNVCTASQVAVAKERGWRVLYWKNNPNEWVDYTGGSDYIKGDVNGDGQVNGTDLVALTNMILGKTNKTDAADVNGDGQVNGTDYVALVNIVLGRTNGSRAGNRAGDATAKLSIEPFDIKAGEEKEMVIDLTNPQDEITLVQFDLKLPSGLSIKKVGGEYDFDIADRTTWRKHSLDANDVEGGATRFLLASSSNATLSGTEGAIIKITLKADNTFSSGDIKLENILLVTPSEKETKQPTYTYHVGESQPSTSEASLATEAFSIKAGEEKELVIDLLNPKDEITLVQFDLRLPSGLALKQINGEYNIDIAGRTTWRKHSLDANATDGIIRFLLSSSSNATLSGTEGAIIKMTLKADNSFASGTIKLENILLVTPDEKEIKPASLEINTDGTGIHAVVMKESDDAIIYSISGQRLAAPKKGINIINGRKVIVK